MIDVVFLTRKLVRFNTINPPGEERDAVEYVGGLLEESGFQTGFYEFAGERTSLVARLPGDFGKPPICFSGHMDTL